MTRKFCALALTFSLLFTGCGNTASSTPTRGIWNGNVYVNDYIGATITLPETWIAATDAEIAMILRVSPDILANYGTDIASEAWDGVHFYDMVAQCNYTGSSIIVMYERLLDEAAGTTEREYLALMRDMTEMEMPWDSGFIIADGVTRIGSTDWHLLTSQMLGTQQHFFVSKQKSYIRSLLITIADDDTLENILTMFS